MTQHSRVSDEAARAPVGGAKDVFRERLLDPIDQAGAASFPCSDPPYWTLGVTMSESGRAAQEPASP